MDTTNLQLHTEQFPLKIIKKLAEEFLHIWQMRKKTILKWLGEAETWSCHKPHTVWAHTVWRELTSLSFSLKSEGFEPHIMAPQLLRPADQRQTPKTSSFESQQGLHQ